MSKEEKTVNEEPEDVFANAEEVEFDESDRMGGTGGVGTQFYGICQRQSDKPSVAEAAGSFWTKNDEGDIEITKRLYVVILESGPRSTRFGEEGQVVCRSYDGREGTSGKTCKECEWNAFRESSIAKDKKCKNSYILLCLPVEVSDSKNGKKEYAIQWSKEPFFLLITAGGIKDWKAYASELQNRHKRPVFSVVTGIATVERKASLGKSFVPVFRALQALGADDTQNIRNTRIAESVRFRPIEETAAVASDQAAPKVHPSEKAIDSDRDPFVDE